MYDLIHLADDEWGNEVMSRVAQEHFAANPTVEFVMVYEHAGWALGYRRDGTYWASANDAAVMGNGPRPSRYSGNSVRRERKEAA